VSRRRAVVIAVAGVLAAVVAGLIVAVTGVKNEPLAVLTPGQAAHLARGLSAPAMSEQAAVVAAELRPQLADGGGPLLPPGSRVRVSDRTFHATSAGTGVVQAVVSGPKPGRWQLLLTKENGQWLLIGTREMP